MLPLAHMGIGSLAVQLLVPKIPKRLLILGAILPDLIDKPLFALLDFTILTRDPTLTNGGRGPGHSLVLLCLLFFFGFWGKIKKVLTLALGVFSHILLDLISDLFERGDVMYQVSQNTSYLDNFLSHFPKGHQSPELLLLELGGALLLIVQYLGWLANTRQRL